MNQDISIHKRLFEVEQAPVETVLGLGMPPLRSSGLAALQ
jgi:hypothetical protein